jgi:hypothetical protein
LAQSRAVLPHLQRVFARRLRIKFSQAGLKFAIRGNRKMAGIDKFF